MKAKTQVALTDGKRMLVVAVHAISVFPTHNYEKSNAAWIMARIEESAARDYFARRPWVTPCDAFPAELTALIHGVLSAECPLQPLMDWVIEYGPANLAAEIEELQSALLTPA